MKKSLPEDADKIKCNPWGPGSQPSYHKEDIVAKEKPDLGRGGVNAIETSWIHPDLNRHHLLGYHVSPS